MKPPTFDVLIRVIGNSKNKKSTQWSGVSKIEGN
jgi:hypothetical protein